MIVQGFKVQTFNDRVAQSEMCSRWIVISSAARNLLYDNPK
jgi:hypothetical protein